MIWFVAAHAQTVAEGGFDAHGFRFASATADLRAPVQFLRPGDFEGLDWSLGALAEYASRPLLFRVDGVDQVALADLWVANVSGGFAPFDAVRVDVTAPLVLSSSDGTNRSGFAPGDVRGSVLIAPFSSADRGFGVGLSAAIDVPTGDPSRYLGGTGIAGSVALSSTVEFGDGTFNTFVGGRFAPNTRPEERPAPTRGGDAVEGGAHLGWVVGANSSLGVEAQVSVAIDPAVRAAIGIPASALGYARYAVDGGNYVSAGVGVGLGAGAGASPVRFVLGGGFGAGGAGPSAPPDRDADGFIDRDDRCPVEGETINQYRDTDGCPDVLPELTFVVVENGTERPEAVITVTDVDGTATEGVGEVRVTGLPGATFRAATEAPSCFGGSAQGVVPLDGTATVQVPIVREEGQLDIVVTDTAGRPMATAEARYLVDDEVCMPPHAQLVDGKGTHRVGATSFLLFVTAPGYGVAQFPIDLKAGETKPIRAQLSPTQVAFREGEIRFATPLRFAAGSAEVGPGMVGLLGQLATVLLVRGDEPFEVWGFGEDISLARARAQAIRNWLLAAGVPAERLTAVGKGAAPAKQSDDVRIVPR